MKPADKVLTPAGIRGKLVKRMRNPADGQVYWLVKFKDWQSHYLEDELTLAPK